MRNNRFKPELIAPAGTIEKMKAAFAFGADAVYLGEPRYSLRSRLNEFDPGKIRQGTAYAHKYGKRVYATANIIAQEKDLKGLSAHVRMLERAGADAVIISDPGVFSIVKQVWPRARIHLSTQANCINSASARFWQKQGIARVILGREATLEDIRKIKKVAPSLELEYFVHGAMCMAYSGRCFLSKQLKERSANQGDCAQPCRWKYERSAKAKDQKLNNLEEQFDIIGENKQLVIEEDQQGSYIFNSKDLCLIKHLDALGAAGIRAFKVEGRAKSVYYIAAVIGAYRKAVDNIGCNKQVAKKESELLYDELFKKTYHRGFTHGFLFGKYGSEELIDRHYFHPEWEFCGQVLASRRLRNRRPFASGKFSILLKAHNTLKCGEEIEALLPGYDIIKVRVMRILDASSRKELKEAHGGQGLRVIIETAIDLPEYSVLRRKISRISPDYRNKSNNIPI